MSVNKTNKTMRQFKEFKKTMIETLTDASLGFDGMWEQEIQQIKSTDNFTDLSKILVDMEYWEQSDAIQYSREITEK